jgi:signal peptidase I
MRAIRNKGKRVYGRIGFRSRNGGTSGQSGRQFLSRLAALLIELAVTAGLAAAVFTFVLGITVQHGMDMYPAIRDGDIVLYLRTGDLLRTEAAVYEADGEIRIGRTAACAGTIVGCTADGQLTFDGIFMPVSFKQGIYQRTYAAGGERLPMTVEDGKYFVLGDNRDEARDSRVFGQIDRERIKGRVIGILRRGQI